MRSARRYGFKVVVPEKWTKSGGFEPLWYVDLALIIGLILTFLTVAKKSPKAVALESLSLGLQAKLESRGEVALDELSADEISGMSDKELVRPAWLKRLKAIQKAARVCGLEIVLVPYKWSLPAFLAEFHTTHRHDMRRLRSQEGGACGRAEAARSLGVTAVTIDNWRKKRLLVTWEDAAGRWKFPRWQFTSDQCLLPGVDECLKLLSGASDNDKLKFFLTRDANAGNSPVELLKDGKVEEAVRLVKRFSFTPLQTEIPLPKERDGDENPF